MKKPFGIVGGVWLLLLFSACGQTAVSSETPIHILRTPVSVPTQAVVAVVPTATELPMSPTVVPSITTVPTQIPSPTQTPISTTVLYTVIGMSVENRPILSYQFGAGEVPLIFVGGIHGGYEWNTILLAYEMIDYFNDNPEQIPEDVTLYIIPSANPDGRFLVTGSNGRFTPTNIPPETDTLLGRFNANGVDLNRNWDCEWRSTALWRDEEISGGEVPFSEPETSALRDYFLAIQPAIVLFWHSASDGVYAAGCPETHPPSYALATLYGEASTYPVHPRFDAYSVTGDASDWLTLQDIPSISIELSTHQALDWEQNLAGVCTLLDYVGSTNALP